MNLEGSHPTFQLESGEVHGYLLTEYRTSFAAARLSLVAWEEGGEFYSRRKGEGQAAGS